MDYTLKILTGQKIRYNKNQTFNALKTEGILRKRGRISKLMAPPESLSQYLSNEYQCYGVSIEL
jgi:hypothetical protein